MRLMRWAWINQLKDLKKNWFLWERRNSALRLPIPGLAQEFPACQLVLQILDFPVPTCISEFLFIKFHLYYSLCACVLSRISCVQLFVTLWTVAYQAPLSMEFSRKEYWSGLPFPSPGDLPHPGIEPMSPASQAVSLPLSHWKSPILHVFIIKPFGRRRGRGVRRE